MREVMGTVAVVDVREQLRSDLDEQQVETACKAAFDLLAEIEDVFTTYRRDSEISRIGRGELNVDDANDWIAEVLSLCDVVNDQSGGAFDIYKAALAEPAASLQAGGSGRPLEPSGMVKGWAIDRAVEKLREGGLDNFTLNVGGDVYAAGLCEGALWQVGLQHPLDTQSVMAILAGSEFAIATSGNYERGAHIALRDTIDASLALLSLTIVGPDVVLADAYATAAFAQGVDGVQWAANLDEFEVFAVTHDGNVLYSEGMSRYLVPLEEGPPEAVAGD